MDVKWSNIPDSREKLTMQIMTSGGTFSFLELLLPSEDISETRLFFLLLMRRGFNWGFGFFGVSSSNEIMKPFEASASSLSFSVFMAAKASASSSVRPEICKYVNFCKKHDAKVHFHSFTRKKSYNTYIWVYLVLKAIWARPDQQNRPRIPFCVAWKLRKSLAWKKRTIQNSRINNCEQFARFAKWILFI